MKDDRGKTVPKHHIKVPRAIAPLIASAISEQADRRFGDEPVWKKVVRSLVALPVMTAVYVGTSSMLFRGSPSRAPWYFTLAFAPVTVALCWLFAVPAARWNEPRWFTPWWYRLGLKRRALKLWGFCPACGYDLCAQERGADGLIVCPECGGAWRWSARIAARVRPRTRAQSSRRDTGTG